MSKRIDLSEAAIDEVKNFWNEKMESSKDAYAALLAGVTATAEKTQFLPVVEYAEQLDLYFTATVTLQYCDLYSEWVDGKGSISCFIERMNGGQAAIEYAKTVERQLHAIMQHIFPHSADSLKTNTANPVIEAEDFVTIKVAVEKFQTDIEAIRDAATAHLEQNTENNAIYTCVIAPIKSQLTLVVKSFEKLGELTEVLKSGYEARLGTLVQEALSTAEDLTTMGEATAPSAGDEIEALKIYDDGPTV